jgi:peroxiredoxin
MNARTRWWFKAVAVPAAGALLLLAGFALAGCQTAPDCCDPRGPGHVVKHSGHVRPLGEGSVVPRVMVRTADGKEVDLRSVVTREPTVLVFYRGGWCMYCRKQLGQLKAIRPDLTAMGYQVVAVSPDKPSGLRELDGKLNLDYTLLSDAQAKAVKAYGLGFRLDAATRAKYQSYGINLEDASGYDHHVLPVPAVYLIGTDGVVDFLHYDPDYKKRLSPDELLAEARKAQEE